jgi:hypothetical protein
MFTTGAAEGNGVELMLASVVNVAEGVAVGVTEDVGDGVPVGVIDTVLVVVLVPLGETGTASTVDDSAAATKANAVRRDQASMAALRASGSSERKKHARAGSRRRARGRSRGGGATLRARGGRAGAAAVLRS